MLSVGPGDCRIRHEKQSKEFRRRIPAKAAGQTLQRME